ncbi:MAG: hypothetical protein AAB910_01675 [Patescibacteria group bacterium]
MFDRLKKLFSRKPQAPRKPTTFLILPMVRILSAREQMNGVMMGRSSSVFSETFKASCEVLDETDKCYLVRICRTRNEWLMKDDSRIIEVFER